MYTACTGLYFFLDNSATQDHETLNRVDYLVGLIYHNGNYDSTYRLIYVKSKNDVHPIKTAIRY